jgi:hypothetical protein
MSRHTNLPKWAMFLLAVLAVVGLLVPDHVLAQDVPPNASTVSPNAVEIVAVSPLHLVNGRGRCVLKLAPLAVRRSVVAPSSIRGGC